MRHLWLAIVLLAQRPTSVAWTGTSTQPSRIELMTVQQAAAAAVLQCTGSHGTPPRIGVVFDTSGRAFWTSVDRGTSSREHCLATAVRNSMRLQPFPSTVMVLVEFPLTGTQW